MKTLKLILIIILIPVYLGAQDHNEWSYNRCIYEVNVRQYTSSGTFAEFSTHLGRLKSLGVGIIWFMPIHPIGVVNRIGSLGSYYSVKDYYGVNPEFGNLNDFKSLVDTIHAKGMFVLMDWVANHTSWDNDLTISHPEWYVKDGNGNFVPPAGTNWSDVIQLDYTKQGLRDYMIDVMKYWINETGIDGFRCDAVSFMPLDFWAEAISELKNLKPGILMLAEDDAPEYQSAGFDMTYGWGYHGFGQGILNNIAAGTNNANTLSNYVAMENNNFQSSHYRMYFTSNHDDNSWHGTVFEQFGNAAETFLVLTSTFRSMPLIYSGEEAGLNRRLLFFDKDQINWQYHYFADLYTKLFNLKKFNKALWNGNDGGQLQRITTTNNPAIFAFIREKDDCRIFGIFNLTNQEKSFTLNGTAYPGNYRNVFTNDSVLFTENTSLTLPAWGYRVYEYGSGLTSVENHESIPKDFILYPNYPNPFNPSTKIKYSIQNSEFVTLKVYDLLGNEIATLVNEYKPAGVYEVDFKATALSSGVYIFTLRTASEFQQRKMLLLK
ncbi:MAG: T9SS type A sorting domain-containing protein [Ignavibacteriaceae bacterium]|nr:T9SS type A sorting domain-containing protein [Ignavibacteriaceae bacterium]